MDDHYEDDPVRAEFYTALKATKENTGHEATMFDVWLMARGLMDTNGRAMRGNMSHQIPEGWELVLKEIEGKYGN